MSVLTWRNVDGPALPNVTDAMRLSRDAMLAGIGNFNKIPQSIFDARTAAAERDASIALNAAADPSNFDSLVPSVTSNPNISQEFINNLAAKRTALQGRNEANVKYDDFMRTSAINQADQATLANNPDIMAGLQNAQLSGDRGALTAILASPAAQQLSAGKRQSLVDAYLPKIDATLKYTQEQTAYADAQSTKGGDDWLTQTIAPGAIAQDDLMKAAGGDKYKLAAISKRLPDLLKDGKVYIPNFRNSGEDVSASSSGSDDAVIAGHTDVYTAPVSTLSLKAVAAGAAALKERTRGNAQLGLTKDEGSSAVGRYQILASQLAKLGPKVFGNDWENVVFNGANQEKLAKQVWNENQAAGKDMTKIYAGLAKAVSDGRITKEQIQKSTWEQIAPLAAQYESGGSTGGYTRNTRSQLTAQQQADMNQMLAAADNVAGAESIINTFQTRTNEADGNAAYLQYVGKNPNQIAEAMVAEGGQYRDANSTDLAAAIKRTAAKYGIGFAEAAAAVNSGFRNDRGFSSLFTHGSEQNLDGSEWAFNTRAYLDDEEVSRVAGILKTQGDSVRKETNDIATNQANIAAYTQEFLDIAKKRAALKDNGLMNPAAVAKEDAAYARKQQEVYNRLLSAKAKTDERKAAIQKRIKAETKPETPQKISSVQRVDNILQNWGPG